MPRQKEARSCHAAHTWNHVNTLLYFALVILSCIVHYFNYKFCAACDGACGFFFDSCYSRELSPNYTKMYWFHSLHTTGHEMCNSQVKPGYCICHWLLTHCLPKKNHFVGRPMTARDTTDKRQILALDYHFRCFCNGMELLITLTRKSNHHIYFQGRERKIITEVT